MTCVVDFLSTRDEKLRQASGADAQLWLSHSFVECSSNKSKAFAADAEAALMQPLQQHAKQIVDDSRDVSCTAPGALNLIPQQAQCVTQLVYEALHHFTLS